MTTEIIIKACIGVTILGLLWAMKLFRDKRKRDTLESQKVEDHNDLISLILDKARKQGYHYDIYDSQIMISSPIYPDGVIEVTDEHIEIRLGSWDTGNRVASSKRLGIFEYSQSKDKEGIIKEFLRQSIREHKL